MNRHGLVETIVWNERTENIVGGHQRVDRLDAASETGKDYTLTVAVINVDEAREKELNILLNNENVQGDWDLEKLGEMFKSGEMDVEGTGFAPADVFQLFGESEATAKAGSVTERLADAIRETADLYDHMMEGVQERDNEEFYLVVCFRDAADCGRFLKEHGLPDNRYQNGAQIEALIKPPKGEGQ